jgi:hypothetical protein
MHCTLIVFVCITFIVGIEGAWIKVPILVDEDAVELTRLAEEFWSLKPAVFQRKGPLVLCEFIDKCCAVEDRFQAISLMVISIANEYRSQNHYATVINTCMNSTVLKQANQSCSSLQKLISPSIMKQDKSIVTEYIGILLDYFTELNNLAKHIHKSCNDEEIHALLCLSNTKLVTACAGKILHKIYDYNGDPTYQEFVAETKQTLIDLNQQLSDLSATNADTV